ncbi:MAG TPA: dipeptidase, partial [Thermoanaerobaculia bacterium]|nr:dipeptidase [Thermoanaerobaculia bacterium]
AFSADDILRIHRAGRIGSLLGAEGGHAIGNSLAVLRDLHRLGVRYMTLTHSATIDWADSATDTPRHGGLNAFGREVIREMARMGMLIDLSHVSAETMHDVLEIAPVPVIFSHSSARALNGHPRNVPDDVLRRLPENGGVVMVTFVPSFISEPLRIHNAEEDAVEARLKALYPGDPARVTGELDLWKKAHPRPMATYREVADHIDHIRAVAGIDHIGIGSDFDGIGSTPIGLEGVEGFPLLFAELLRRGYSEEDLARIAGLNLLRVMRRVESMAAELQESTPMSEAALGAE